jgi:hypothetical protein
MSYTKLKPLLKVDIGLLLNSALAKVNFWFLWKKKVTLKTLESLGRKVKLEIRKLESTY